MKKVVIKIKNQDKKEYPIFIGKGILRSIQTFCDLHVYSKIAVVTDTQIEKLFLKNAHEFFPRGTQIIILPFGERAKNMQCVEEIWRQLLQADLDRKSAVINIGGGVISDMGAFAASTYMRGIDFIQVPTTLLSQVDASVGGKTGVNFEGVKNLVGTFAQPTAIVIDIAFLLSLPKRIFIEGFGEIIKHGLIMDKKYFEFVTSKKPEQFSEKELTQIIETSCKIKAGVVATDEKEKGNRRLVNFGHTIGHAIEALSLSTKNPILHGEAISIGMVGESYISYLLGILSEKEFTTIKDKLLKAGLPITVTEINKDAIFEKIQLDKKMERGEIQWTLLEGIGKGSINKNVAKETVYKAIDYVLV